MEGRAEMSAVSYAALPEAEKRAAAIDQATQQAVEGERRRCADDLENAATDCDGHTPYSILMALAGEFREAAAQSTPKGEGAE